MCRIPVFSVGIVLMLGAIITKTWRICLIFNSENFRVVRLSFAKTTVVFFASTSCMLCALVLSVSVDPLTLTLYVKDENRPLYNYHECTAERGVGAIMIVCGLAFTLVTACYYAFLVRNAYEIFNDAVFIGYAVFLVSFCYAIVFGLQYAIGDSSYAIRKTMFVIRSLGIILSTLALQYLLIFKHVPRLVYLLLSAEHTTFFMYLPQHSMQHSHQQKPLASKIDVKQRPYTSEKSDALQPQQQQQQKSPEFLSLKASTSAVHNKTNRGGAYIRSGRREIMLDDSPKTTGVVMNECVEEESVQSMPPNVVGGLVD